MLKINNEIIPNKSIGGITLDSNIDELLLGIERNSDYYITNFSENYIVINDKSGQSHYKTPKIQK